MRSEIDESRAKKRLSEEHLKSSCGQIKRYTNTQYYIGIKKKRGKADLSKGFCHHKTNAPECVSKVMSRQRSFTSNSVTIFMIKKKKENCKQVKNRIESCAQMQTLSQYKLPII